MRHSKLESFIKFKSVVAVLESRVSVILILFFFFINITFYQYYKSLESPEIFYWKDLKYFVKGFDEILRFSNFLKSAIFLKFIKFTIFLRFDTFSLTTLIELKLVGSTLLIFFVSSSLKYKKILYTVKSGTRNLIVSFSMMTFWLFRIF